MENKPYALGILVGRFQTLHTGHEDMIRKALELCDRVGLFVGSSQESGTRVNPFPYALRRDMLEEAFPGTLRVAPLPDIGVGNNGAWGDYVLDSVRRVFGMLPDLLVSGKEERRKNWFDHVEGLSIAELYVPKTIDISASELRGHLIAGDFEAWREYVNPVHWHRWEELRRLTLLAQDNEDTDSV